MNADHTPARKGNAPVHQSVHTKISGNLDLTTGERSDNLMRTELVMCWLGGVGGSLLVRFEATELRLAPESARDCRSLRGALGG